MEGHLHHRLAMLAVEEGRLEDARALYDQAVDAKLRGGDVWEAHGTRQAIAEILTQWGQFSEARELTQARLEYGRTRANPLEGIVPQVWLAAIAQREISADRGWPLAETVIAARSGFAQQYGLALILSIAANAAYAAGLTTIAEDLDLRLSVVSSA